MPYQEWWSLPTDEGLSLILLRRRIATAMGAEGLRLGVGYIPCQPEVIAPAVEEGRVDVFFCLAGHLARQVAYALDEDLAELLDSELRELERSEADREEDEHCVVSVSLHAAREGWEGPRMLLTDESDDNQRLWPLACIVGHVLARVLGGRIFDPGDSWPVWDPDAVITAAG